MSFLLIILIVTENWNMSQDIRERISKNLYRLRASQGLKREELSLALGFDNSYISKLERKTINITIDRLEKIASFLSVDITELLKK